MKKDMMWVFLIHLSTHFWQDASSKPYGMYLDKPYTEENNVDIETWDEVMRTLPRYGINKVLIDLGDAVKYDSHPEICAPDAWSKDFLRQKLDEIRSLGMEPIPKLNFSAAHDAWLKGYGRMLSTPEYYKVCADLIKEVCGLFGTPSVFHLGMDEEIDYYQRGYEMTVCRHGKLWEHDLMFLLSKVEKCGVRPWFWTSFAVKEHRDFVRNELPKSVLTSAGWFGNLLPREQRVMKEQTMDNADWIDILNDAGFDIIGECSTWGFKASTLQVLRYCREHVDPSRLAGFSTAPWLMTEKRELHGLLHGACKMYYERLRVFPETVE